MKFYDYVSGYDIFKKFKKAHDGNRWYEKPNLSLDEFYVQMAKQVEAKDDKGYSALSFERDWNKAGKPYYKVYPSIVPMLTKIDIDRVEFGQIAVPSGLDSLLVRFSDGNRLGGIVRAIGINCFEEQGKKYILFLLDVGLRTSRGNHTPVSIVASGNRHDSIGDSYRKVFENKDAKRVKGLNQCTIKEAYKLVCTLCLLGDSPELIQPEVLNADEHKLKGQHNIEALVAKARRRGKYGFNIGKDIEVMPHYRRPHLALVWYGPGKKKSKIIPRKGSIVHRSKVEKIPTGYAMEELIMAATEQQINEGWRQHILEAEMTPEVRLHILNELVDLVTDELAECDEEDKEAFKSELEKYKKLRNKAKEEFDA